MSKGFFVLIALTGVVFFFIARVFNVSSLWQTLQHAAPVWIALGVIIALSGAIFGTWRWQALLAVVGYRATFKRILLINLASGPLMLFPGRMGDLVKAYALKHEVPMPHTIGTIVLEKAIDVSSLLLFVAIGSYGSGYRSIGFWALVALAGIIMGLGLLTLSRSRLLQWIPASKFKRLLGDLSYVLAFVPRNARNLAVSAVSSLANWSTNVFVVYCFFRALDVSVPLGAIFALLPLCILVGLIPLTIAGMGTRDSALIALFAPFATASQALGVGILYSAAGYWLAVIIGIPFFQHMRPLALLPDERT